MKCIVCYKTNISKMPLVNEISKYTKNSYPLFKCNCCGMIRPNPLPYKEENKKDIYDSPDNIKFYDQKTKKIDRESYEYNYYFKHFEPYLEIIRKYKISGKALDIGCGAGHLLKLLSNKGLEAEGIDVSPVLIKALKLDGFKVNCYEIGDKKLEKSKYDLITLNQVLEHIVDPEEFVKELNKLLKKKGHIIIAVPYIYGLVPQILRSKWYGLGYGQHLNFFSQESLKILFERNGFEIIEFRIMIVDYAHPKFPEFLNILANALSRLIVALGMGDNLFLVAKKTGKILK